MLSLAGPPSVATRRLCIALLLLSAAAPGLAWRPLNQALSFVSSLIEGVRPDQEQLEVDSRPWFCHDLDCPPFKVVDHNEGYETRNYEKADWVATTVSGLLFETSVATGYKRLFDYISGENANGTKIPLTTPVFTGVNPKRSLFSKSNFTVGLYVPPQYQGSVPKPTNADVWVVEIAEGIAYVSQFGGYLVDDATLSLKAEALKKDLIANEEPFSDELYYTATYDTPTRLRNRHNEIMYSKKA